MSEHPEFGTYTPGTTAKAIVALARHSPLGRGPAKKTAAALLKQVSGNTLDLELWGGHARLHLDNGNEIKAALQPQRYDPAELEFLSHHLSKPNSIFIDIGANAGLYSLNLALRSKNPGIILAIEPNPDMVARASANLHHCNPHLAKSGIDIRVVQTALGDRRGTARLDTGNADPGNAQIVDNGSGTLDVKMQPLLDLTESNGIKQIDGLKIDVEGYEDRVLGPFFAKAPSSLHPAAVVIEANADFWDIDCLELLRTHGYKEVARTRNNALLERGKN